ncbi:MAG: dihydrofolate reductase, partial [Verrucomicrobiales bacterium]
VAHSIDEAVSEAFEEGANELVVCGGGSVYAAALPYADELILTLVDAHVADGEGARFPDYAAEIEWETAEQEAHPPDSENQHALSFVTLRRLRPSLLRPARLHLL